MRKLAVAIVLLLLSASPAWCWTKEITAEQGTVGDRAQGANFWTEAGTEVTISNTVAHNGSKSIRVRWLAGTDDNFSTAGTYYQMPASIPNGGEVWFRSWAYYPTEFTFCDTGDNVKQMRIGYSNSTAGTKYVSILAHQHASGALMGDSEGPGDGWRTSFLDPVPRNTWICLEMYLKVAYPGSNTGIVRIWKDGVLVLERVNVPTVETNGTPSFILSCGVWNRGPCATQYQYWDDTIITSDRPTARDAAGNYMIGTGSYTPVEDTTAPTITSMSVGTNGTTLAVNMSEVVQGGTTGNGGFTVSPSGGAATVTYVSGSGSPTLYYTLSRSIAYGETITAAYTKPASAYVEDTSSATNDLASVSGISVTNYVPPSGGSAPVMSALAPSGALACTDYPYTPVTFSLTTNVAATCRGSLTNVGYDTMGAGANFDTTGGTSHSSVGLPGLPCGSAFTLYVQCRDGSGNTTTTPGLISASVADSEDTVAPMPSSLLPSGSQTFDSGNQTISLVTNENATCRWGTLSLSDYYSYSNVMTGGGTTAHTADLTDLVEGTTYTRYGRCIDAAGNQSSTFTWSWSYPASGGGLSPATLRGKFSGGYFK